jgi:hypothetical protein
MKVGDLVKNGQGSVGIVYGIGYGGRCRSKDKCPFPNPDIHVYDSSGYAIWSYNALEIISKAT